MRAADILKTKGHDVVSVSGEATLGDAISTMADRNIGAVVVNDSAGALIGILSERDIMRMLSGAPTGYRETKVSAVMTATVFTRPPESSIDDLLDLMTEKRIRHVPIMDGSTMVGLLSIGDVVKHRIRQAEGEAEALKSYITAG